MKLFQIIKNVQNSNDSKRTQYCRMLFNVYKDFIIRYFIIYAPYTEDDQIDRFVTALGEELFSIIEKTIVTFKTNKNCLEEELEERLFNYFQAVACSVLDHALIRLINKGESDNVYHKAKEQIITKYQSLIEPLILDKVKNSNWGESKKLQGFELEKFWVEETQQLKAKFFESKFPKLIMHFKKANKATIFRNYMKKGVKNFLIDQSRGKSIKKMRRIILYRDDLPQGLFEHLINLKGHGNLFYYKSKIDCLSVRDIYKALSVIKDLDTPEWDIKNLKILFKEKEKRAEYQRFIDNIAVYIEENCKDEECSNRLHPNIKKVLLYIGDVVMKRRLSISEIDVVDAGKKLEQCVVCLEINKQNFFYRIL